MNHHDRIDPAQVDATDTAAEMVPGRVGDRMSRRPLTVRADAAAADAWRLMRTHKIRHLPVLDADDRLVGIVTDRDLRQLLFDPALQARLRVGAPAGERLTVDAVMTRGVVTARPETSLIDAARLMHERKIGALPVVEDDRVTGIITESDVLGAFVEVVGARAIPRSLRWAIAMRRGAA